MRLYAGIYNELANGTAQASATYGTRAKRGTLSELKYSNYVLIKN
jgi:hypothetical protein